MASAGAAWAIVRLRAGRRGGAATRSGGGRRGGLLRGEAADDDREAATHEARHRDLSPVADAGLQGLVDGGHHAHQHLLAWRRGRPPRARMPASGEARAPPRWRRPRRPPATTSPRSGGSPRRTPPTAVSPASRLEHERRRAPARLRATPSGAPPAGSPSRWAAEDAAAQAADRPRDRAHVVDAQAPDGLVVAQVRLEDPAPDLLDLVAFGQGSLSLPGPGRADRSRSGRTSGGRDPGSPRRRSRDSSRRRGKPP